MTAMASVSRQTRSVVIFFSQSSSIVQVSAEVADSFENSGLSRVGSSHCQQNWFRIQNKVASQCGTLFAGARYQKCKRDGTAVYW